MIWFATRQETKEFGVVSAVSVGRVGSLYCSLQSRWREAAACTKLWLLNWKFSARYCAGVLVFDQTTEKNATRPQQHQERQGAGEIRRRRPCPATTGALLCSTICRTTKAIHADGVTIVIIIPDATAVFTRSRCVGLRTTGLLFLQQPTRICFHGQW